jgi:hypothetical protein
MHTCTGRICDWGLDLQQVRHEIKEIGKSPVAEKMYPITSDWVPLTDVLAILARFEKHWRQKYTEKPDNERRIVEEILGKA